MAKLYEGTLDEAVWGRALLAVADRVRACATLLLAVNPSTGQVLREENHRCDPSALEQYARHWIFEDLRREYLTAIPVGSPTTEEKLRIPDWRRAPILNDFLLPNDLPHFMPTWLHKSTTKAVVLSLLGTRKRGPFDAEDIEALRQLLPHVSRALEIRDRLEQARVRAETLASHFSSLSFGVAVLDSTGKLLEANGIVEALLRTNSGISRKLDGTLTLRGSAGNELSRWIGSGARSASTETLLHVPRPPAAPLSVMLTPLPVRSASWINRDPRWLLLIFDPERRVGVCAELIARDLGISAREADVAALLAGGYSLKGLATRLGVSEHTTRSQLKSIFRKTGISSQAELIRRIATGPATCGFKD